MFVVLLRTFGDFVMVGRVGAINSSKSQARAAFCGRLNAPLCPLRSQPFASFLRVEVAMNIETLSIEDLATLRDRVIAILSDKVAARQKELLAESERVGALVTLKSPTALRGRSGKGRQKQKSQTIWQGKLRPLSATK